MPPIRYRDFPTGSSHTVQSVAAIREVMRGHRMAKSSKSQAVPPATSSKLRSALALQYESGAIPAEIDLFGHALATVPGESTSHIASLCCEDRRFKVPTHHLVWPTDEPPMFFPALLIRHGGSEGAFQPPLVKALFVEPKPPRGQEDGYLGVGETFYVHSTAFRFLPPKIKDRVAIPMTPFALPTSALSLLWTGEHPVVHPQVAAAVAALRPGWYRTTFLAGGALSEAVDAVAEIAVRSALLTRAEFAERFGIVSVPGDPHLPANLAEFEMLAGNAVRALNAWAEEEARVYDDAYIDLQAMIDEVLDHARVVQEFVAHPVRQLLTNALLTELAQPANRAILLLRGALLGISQALAAKSDDPQWRQVRHREYFMPTGAAVVRG